MAKKTAKSRSDPVPGTSEMAAGAGRPRARWRRRLPWLGGALALILLGLVGYNLLLVYRFEHAIYHPLPSGLATHTPSPVAATATRRVLARAPSHAAAPVPIATETPAPAPTTPTPGSPRAPATATPAPGRINVLLLGTDQRPEDAAARSDTLIVLNVDPQWKTVGMLSVPRDLQVPIPGFGLQKINAAYFFGQYDKLPGGGPGLAVTTVSQYFGEPIPYYVAINFTGFERVIDMIGGIDIYVPAAIDDPLYPGPNNSYKHVHFDAGCQHMDGARALEYARTRHADSDFGRNRRQQQVIQAVRARVLQLDVIPHYAALLTQVGDSIATNIPPEQQWQFAQLAGQIAGSDLYSAQIDDTLVSVVPGTSNLALNSGRAQPLLDWFFGRGRYAGLKPGTRLTPLPSTPTSVPGAEGAAPGRCP